MNLNTQIIDVFAGPGGLGEGFSAYNIEQNKKYPFQIKISVEMEENAHKTLRLRAFLRYFNQNPKLETPQIYVDYISGKNKLLGKLLEFRSFDFDDRKHIKTENDTREWDLLSPEFYCPKEYDKAKKLYSEQWGEIEKAIKRAMFEARRMTLGPDEKDIHKAIAEQIDPNVPSILIGGPPCQAFSMAGRSRRKGHVTNNVSSDTDENGKAIWDQDSDGRTWLYKEYIKIISEFQPEVFVMENVKGMLTAKVKDAEGNKVDIWRWIFADLNKPANVINTADPNLEYDIYSLACDINFKGGSDELQALNGNSFVLHAKNYGIPQARERVILLGIKKDISEKLSREFRSFLVPVQPEKQTTVQDAIGDLPVLRAGVGTTEHFSVDDEIPVRTKLKQAEETDFWRSTLNDKLTNTVTHLAESLDEHQQKVWSILNRAFSGHEKLLKLSKKFNSFTDKQTETTNTSIEKFTKFDFTRLEKETENNQSVIELKKWYTGGEEKTWILNHEARSHMDTDLCRYIYSSSYSLIKPQGEERDYPRLQELEEAGLDPKGHKNKKSFVDRFRTQIWNQPSTTVTSHIAKDGHYYIHPDPSQMRSLTVREAARLQTFPDNYFFEGPRTAQFIQVGNAVPPLLANKIAGVVNNIFNP
ncbi:DNA cytosine methyltransferase [Thalassomonas viridans]|uniref:Cytosine-specific methyltransferase n=1 Tax=Thalassomonas viridans TaxID=137584 RepID=A0AAF0C7U2_9GAMM|nr:DNA (cytosine-5-)-methyltransferase [Thalassomonas viridans]WDE03706.1 DNA cytosine methyltransferase [Thalassomonas viridans]